MRFITFYFGDLYNRWVLAGQQKGFVNARDFEQCKHIEIIVLTEAHLLTFVRVYKSLSHEKSISFKIRSFFPLNFFGPQLIN